MALSTSELVTDIFSEPSAEGQSSVTLISALIPSAGAGSWLLGVLLPGPPDTVRRTLFLIRDEHESHSWMRLLKNIFANPYLFDEGPTVSSPAFLFKGLPGAGAALFGVAPGVARYVERLPFEARDSAVGEAERGNPFGEDVS